MHLKFYLFVNNKEITILPGQLDGNKEWEEIKFKLGDGIALTNSPSSNKAIILAMVDVDKEEVVKVLSEHAPDYFLSTDEFRKIKEENKAILMAGETQARDHKYKIPKDLFIEEMNWNLMTTGVEIEKYPMLIGPKGCGKSKTAIAIAQAMGYEYYPINCGSIFKPKQTLVGTMMVSDGTTYLVDSEFLKYFRSDKKVLIFLDEVSRIPAGAANYFMTIVDRLQNYVYVEELGERVYKGKDVVFIAAGNFGYEYADTRNLDGAFVDRFTKFMVDYLPEAKEIELIMQYLPKSKQSDVTKLVKRANTCRKAQNIRTAVSTRQLLDMAEFMVQGFSYHEVIKYIFMNLFVNGSMDEREVVNKMFAGLE